MPQMTEGGGGTAGLPRAQGMPQVTKGPGGGGGDTAGLPRAQGMPQVTEGWVGGLWFYLRHRACHR